MSWADQAGYDRRFGWGRRAVRAAVERGDVIVLVDVLSFTTCVGAAIAHGATIHPFPMREPEAAAAYAAEVGATVRTGDLDDPSGRRALSPVGFGPEDAGRSWVLCSPNGATCSRMAADAPAVFAACLRNATAVGRAASQAAAACDAALTVVACGELWNESHEGENVLRPALEDALGAGAVLAAAGGARSPEAEACTAQWLACADRVEELVTQCASGRELVERGYADDVAFAWALDVDTGVPRLSDGAYRP